MLKATETPRPVLTPRERRRALLLELGSILELSVYATDLNALRTGAEGVLAAVQALALIDQALEAADRTT